MNPKTWKLAMNPITEGVFAAENLKFFLQLFRKLGNLPAINTTKAFGIFAVFQK
jgi:hypothetical protein